MQVGATAKSVTSVCPSVLGRTEVSFRLHFEQEGSASPSSLQVASFTVLQSPKAWLPSVSCEKSDGTRESQTEDFEMYPRARDDYKRSEQEERSTITENRQMLFS